MCCSHRISTYEIQIKVNWIKSSVIKILNNDAGLINLKNFFSLFYTEKCQFFSFIYRSAKLRGGLFQ